MIAIETQRGKSPSRRIFAIVFFLLCVALESCFPAPASIQSEATVAASPEGRTYRTYKPFSKLAVGVNFGTFGAGIEAVTPISRKTNLRVDGTFFNYGLSLVQDGIHYNGNLNMRNARISYDFYPFAKGFRISGGVSMYNKFDMGAKAMVAPNNTITLNNTDYYSSASDPIHGTASLSFGRKVAPTVTVGWGNAIPRSGHHFAFPFEIGAAFTGTPSFNLNVSGSGCDTAPCAVGTPVTTLPEFNSNLAAQRSKINNDISPLRVYPILNGGITYRF